MASVAFDNDMAVAGPSATAGPLVATAGALARVRFESRDERVGCTIDITANGVTTSETIAGGKVFATGAIMDADSISVTFNGTEGTIKGILEVG